MRHGQSGKKNTHMFKPETYKNKRVFVTGHTGFKGSWLALWLKNLGAVVTGYALEPYTNPSIFHAINLDKEIESEIGDILDREKLEKSVSEFKPDIIFHLAAQPLVRLSYIEPVKTYETNVIGTLNVLEAARKCSSVKAFVNITTDKCYENIEQDYAYKEDDKMGGYDMYSSSKGCSEILSASYRNSFLKDEGFLLATARAGNVIGGGDWSTDRLVPDCIKAINKGEDIVIRSPQAVRPWQHVLEPLSGYLTLGEKLLEGKKEFADGYNFGPEKNSVLTVEDIVKTVIKYYEKGNVIIKPDTKFHEANLLMLDITKAKTKLNWHPKYNAEDAVKKTVLWYKNFYANEDMRAFTAKQIKDYMEK